jgi:hypothetical protein
VSNRLLTASGVLVDIANPDPAAIRIVDIAHALSRICRFGGHVVVYPYSVAQHSLMVSEFVPPDMAMAGLLHDAAEAYLGDLVSPVKALLPDYLELERRWNLAIGERFGLGDQLANQHEAIKAADAVALATERRDLMPANPGWKPPGVPYAQPVQGMGVEFAKDSFLNRFDRLGGQR